jgi:hypothetical protein
MFVITGDDVELFRYYKVQLVICLNIFYFCFIQAKKCDVNKFGSTRTL